MQAVGLRLEENGTVLALREDGCASGAKWNCVPENVLQRLDSAAKVSRPTATKVASLLLRGGTKYRVLVLHILPAVSAGHSLTSNARA